ncbi:TVP38/TMEM64 family protein [Clostridium sp. SYSU_GA19001]|uniref:TVP38/TMEM64 family protein n=1 Tax=Clostridium caldaquaticum TaxID=2940653 RepID=UPI002076E14B|nr:TVP38/TMEM64 family protein [Clostridium caldaquaticum]MCM8711101.1 TVP38/TMEM64 family protein [Clostridium caldaquaticum]
MYKILKKTTKAVLILSISFIFIYFFIKYKKYFIHISITNLRNYILSFGSMAWIMFIIIFSFKPIVIVFPSLVLMIIAGNIFGHTKGFVLSFIGLYTSATFAFGIAKKLGKPFVYRITRDKLIKLDDNIEVHGFKIILLLRLASVFAYDPLSYAAGLTKIKYRDFIIATMLGTLPEMITYTYLGGNMANMLSKKFIIPIIALIAIATISSYIYKSYSKVKT